MIKRYFLISNVLFLVLTATPLLSQSLDLRYLHAMVGVFDADKSWQIDDGARGRAADIENMIYGGGAAQFSHMNGAFQYGFETGGLVSFRSDTSSFVRVNDNGATVLVDVDNLMWLMDVSLAGYISYQLSRYVRVFASIGPAFLFGSILVEQDDVSIRSETGETVNYSPNDREWDVDIGGYGRLGMDVTLPNQFVVGVSARQLNAELDFGDTGTIELDDTQFFLNLGKRF